MEKAMPFKRLGVMLDCSRNAVPTVEFLKTYIDDLSKMGYNALELYTEDTYELDGEPTFGYLRGRFTKAEMKEINAYAKTKGVEMIPCIQTLAHLNCALRWVPYNGIVDCNDIMLIGDERTYALIDKMFATMRECYDTEVINIGMDEAHFVGLGRYLDQHGYRDRFEILLDHLRRVAEIAAKYGFKPHMWSDMFFRLANHGQYYCRPGEPIDIPEEVKSKVPENVSLTYWDYYSKNPDVVEAMLTSHESFGRETWFAGGCWDWSGFTPCNRNSMECNAIAVPKCAAHKIDNVMMTVWGDNGHECSKLAVYPAIFHVSCLAHGITDPKEMSRRFADLFGISMEEALLLDDLTLTPKKSDPFDFSGIGPTNPGKYMLYSDPFLGFFDKTADEAKAPLFRDYAKDLEKYRNDKKFGYVFETQYRLSLVMAEKYTLGVRIRRAYREGNKEELARLADTVRSLIPLVSDFRLAFCRQWDLENKPNGFEVHDNRLGGLMTRLAHVADRLSAFVSGDLPALPELEEEIQSWNLNPALDGRTLNFNWFGSNVTPGVF